MLADLTQYEETKRNESCPCGSGKIFKKCCMKEYREAKKRGEKGKRITISTFSPLKPLENDEVKEFMSYYDRILIFSYKYRTNSTTVVADDLNLFLTRERDYFYEHKEEVLEAFIKDNPLEQKSELLEAIRDTKYDMFVLLEYADHTAVVADTEGQTYNVQALTTPFNELFSKKPLMIKTALVPYKNRYILDGRYSVVQEKMSRGLQKEIDIIPTLGIPTAYRKGDGLIVLPVTINLTVFCDALHFEEMEKILLRNIPSDFTQKMVDMFKDTPFERASFSSSFMRSMDFLNEINGKEEKEAILFNGLSVTNYELNGRGNVIPYDILKNYYQQKSLDKSISKGVYETVQKAKEIVRDRGENRFQASSFYTMLGVFYIYGENIDEFNFLENLYSKEGREAFTLAIESLFETLSQSANFEITPIFLDFALNLDGIIDEIDNHREYVGTLYQVGSPKKFREYSIYKGKQPNIFERYMKN